ncbi:hypothetical protein DFJ74DRAFT_774062 [Hyaloraphidium curvatum]|nr:hypothetical protein DFJ74DRAFT_774062 [Hyaloraphidium curvatum]
MPLLRPLARAYSTLPASVDIAVLGAGVAGLAAAQQIRSTAGSRGPSVAVLEARTRPLGRLHSLDLGNGVKADAGAQWLHADAAKAGALEGWFREAGVSYSEWHVEERALDVPDPLSLPAGDKSEPVDALRANLAPGAPGTNLLFPGGLAKTFGPLADGLDVRYGVKVTGIRVGEGKGRKVAVETGEGTVEADWVVCALPLPILRSLPITPSLTPTHLSSLSQLRTRTLEKLLLPLPPSLPAQLFGTAHRLLLRTPTRGRFTLLDMRPWTGQPWAGLFATDEAGKALASLSEEEAGEVGRELVLGAVRAAGLPAPDLPTKGAVRSAWSLDPFSLGSFTSVLPGASYSPLPPITLPGEDGPEPRVLFAGEHAPPSGSAGDVGTVQGAWMSGVRAGEEAGLAWGASRL